MTYHICPCAGCNKPVHPSRLMCYGCWKRVPRQLQQRVYATWKGGSVQDYNAARSAAITAVDLHRHPVKHSPLPGGGDDAA